MSSLSNNVNSYISRPYFLNNYYRHSEWRKLAKKARRKRIRQKFAQVRDKKEEQGMDNFFVVMCSKVIFL